MPADDGWMEELADESAAELSKRFNGIYSQAWREMRGKFERAMADYERERKERMKALDDTPEAKRAFGKWCESRLANAQWLETMADELAARAADADELAMAAVRNETPRVYAENANMAAYAIEGAMGAYTGYTLLDDDTVRLLAMESGALVPEVPYPKTQRAKDVRWNRRKFRSAITQGILQGESVPKVAKRVQSVIGMDSRAATRAARTALTGAQNAGRVNAYKRMADEGCRLKQEWMATRDVRTRDSHRRLDGERVEIGESWQAERGELRFPGDPQAHPSETWNCRCRVRAVVDVKGLKGLERRSNFPPGLTYEQWKVGRSAETYSEAAKNSVSPGMAYSSPVYRVNNEAVRSDDYETKVERVFGSTASKAATTAARAILRHRGGTNGEDLYAIDLDTGRVISSVTTSTLESRVEPTARFKKKVAAAQAGGSRVATLHNHPASGLPSTMDLQSLDVNGCEFGAIACHDGGFYTYRRVSEGQKGYNLNDEARFDTVVALWGTDEARLFRAIEELYGMKIEHIR